MSQDKDVVELVDLVIALGKVAQKVAAKAPVAEDLAALIGLMPLLSPAMDGVANVPAELKALSADEAAALTAQIVAGLGLVDAKAADIAEKALKCAWSLEQLVLAVKA